MTVDVRHGFQSSVPDALDPAIVKPSHWNSAHLIKADGPTVLGLIGAGPAQTVVEITPTGVTPLSLIWNGANVVWSSVGTTVLADNSVTDAKLRDSVGVSVIGRSVNTVGDPADIVAAADDTLLRRVGSVVSFGVITLGMAPVNLWTFAKLQQIAGLSVPGVAGAVPADMAAITAANDGEVLRRSGATLGFGTVVTAGLANANVTNAKLADVAAATIKGRAVGAGVGAPTDLTPEQALAIAGPAASSGFFAYNSVTDVDVTGDGTSFTLDFDAELSDVGNEFAGDTHTPTVTGFYNYGGTVTHLNIVIAHTVGQINLVTSNRSYLVANTNPGVVAAAAIWVWPWSVFFADMDAGDTAVVTTQISNGTKTVDILGGGAATPYTYFSGHRVR